MNGRRLKRAKDDKRDLSSKARRLATKTSSRKGVATITSAEAAQEGAEETTAATTEDAAKKKKKKTKRSNIQNRSSSRIPITPYPREKKAAAASTTPTS